MPRPIRRFTEYTARSEVSMRKLRAGFPMMVWPLFVERHEGGTRFEAVLAGNDDRLVALHETDQRISGSEIDDYAFT
jgi:hypothetical protein